MKKNYIVVDESNQWLDTVTNVTEAELKDEIDIIKADGRNEGKIFAYEYVGEAIEF